LQTTAAVSSADAALHDRLRPDRPSGADPPDLLVRRGLRAAGIVVTTIGVLLFAYRRRIFMLLFSIVWSLGVLVALGSDFTQTREARARVRAGDYVVTEGCLEHFHPGSPATRRAARSAGPSPARRFSYANGSVGPRYHVTEAAGGAVHPDARVRVTHLADSEDILRLQVIPHACPPAPDPPE